MKKTFLWIGALVIGAILGLLGLDWLNGLMDFVATVYTRLFQLLAVPTIVLAVITTFATFGSKGSGKIFGRTLIYTLLTTFAAFPLGAWSESHPCPWPYDARRADGPLHEEQCRHASCDDGVCRTATGCSQGDSPFCAVHLYHHQYEWLWSGIGAPVAILGIILPIYTIIDMVETAENVWSDSCVCAMTNHDLR